MDADINEQVDIYEDLFQMLISAMNDGNSVRFGGFSVIQSASPDLYVTVESGMGGFQISTNRSVLIERSAAEEAVAIGPFTTWIASRTDCVYLDIVIEEIDSSDDVQIVNPEIGEETCVDIRLSYTIEIEEDSSNPPASPPTNHYYVKLATVTKTSGSTITTSDITMEVDDFKIDFGELTVGDLTINSSINFGSGVYLDGADIEIATVNTDQLADDSVDEDKIASTVVDGSTLEQNSGDGKLRIKDLGVTTAKINTDAVTSAKIGDDEIHKEHLNSDVVNTGLVQETDGSLSVDGIIDGLMSVELKISVMEIGDWNMDADGSKVINFTSIAYDKIRAYWCLIRKDSGVATPALYMFGSWGDDGSINLVDVGAYLRFQLFRTASGQWDSTEYDATSYNRGWIIILHEA